ncbi:MAG: cupin domain-containing protein [Ferruginibacter sp.]
MKHKIIPFLAGALVVFLCITAFSPNDKNEEGYILQKEKDIAKEEAGPHAGGGKTTGMDFFAKDPAMKLAFRKRVLHPGSSIGYHLQEKEEIYYVVSGNGIMDMNGKSFPVEAGDAILTHTGSSHGLKPAADKDLVLIINYELK